MYHRDIKWMVSEQETADFVAYRLDNLKPGETMVYHVGNLANDRKGVRNRQIDDLASHAYRRAKNGGIHLTQVRRHAGFEYRATGRGSRPLYVP